MPRKRSASSVESFAPSTRRVFMSMEDQAKAGPAADAAVDHVIRESLGHLTTATARLFDRNLAAGLRRYAVPIGQWSLLLMLWAEDGISQRALSERASIDEATAARTLARMVRDGLVRRRKSKSDKRQYEIVLTDRARELRDYLIFEAEAVNRRAIDRLSKDEILQFRTLLTKVHKNLG